MDRRGFFSTLVGSSVLLTKGEPMIPLSKVGKITQTIVVELDGKKLAEALLPGYVEYARTHGIR